MLLSDALEEHAANGNHVSGEQGEESEGDDDVEGGGGAEVDEADDAGADRGEINGVVGNIALVVHLKPTVSPLLHALAILQRTHPGDPFGEWEPLVS